MKVNAVLQQDKNADEWQKILEIAERRPIDVRFIEMMPIGRGRECTGVSNDELLKKIQEQYPGVCKDDRVHGNGPAVYYHIPRFVGSSNCNRIRMTATGELKPCLCYRDTMSVRDAARYGTDSDIREKLQEAIQMKPKQHCFDVEEDITEQHKMVQIGG